MVAFSEEKILRIRVMGHCALVSDLTRMVRVSVQITSWWCFHWMRSDMRVFYCSVFELLVASSDSDLTHACISRAALQKKKPAFNRFASPTKPTFKKRELS